MICYLCQKKTPPRKYVTVKAKNEKTYFCFDCFEGMVCNG